MHVTRKPWGIVAVGLFLPLVSTATAKYSGSSGTAQDPYRIANTADLTGELNLLFSELHKTNSVDRLSHGRRRHCEI